jgi:hypothetical protein
MCKFNNLSKPRVWSLKYLGVYSYLVMNFGMLIICFVIITGELIAVVIMIPSAECTCYNYIAFFRSFVCFDIGTKLYEICCCIVLSVITMPITFFGIHLLYFNYLLCTNKGVSVSVVFFGCKKRLRTLLMRIFVP